MNSLLFICIWLNVISLCTSTPNIVLFLADDLGYSDIGAFGAPSLDTPNIDRLARNGIKLPQFYSAHSVCTPSRAGLMTGRLPRKLGIFSTKAPGVLRVFFPFTNGSLPNVSTIPSMLKQAPRPYASKLIGKWHLGHVHSLPTQRGWDEFYGIPYSNDMGVSNYGLEDVPVANRVVTPLPLYDNETIIEQPLDFDTATERFTEHGIEFIERQAAHNTPFLLMMSYYQPHTPLNPSPAFANTSLRGPFGDCVMELDHSVGQVMEALERQGLINNTFVMFASDNGPWIKKSDKGGTAGPFRDGKGTTWEGGLRVPVIVSYPSRLASSVSSFSTMSLLDLYPTFASLAGVQLDPSLDLDGRDMLPFLQQPNISNRERVIVYMYQNTVMAVRFGAYKLHMYTRCGYCSEPPQHHDPPLLFNVEHDLAEKHPLPIDDYRQEAEHLMALYEQAVVDVLNEATPQLEQVGLFVAPCSNPEPEDKPCYSNSTADRDVAKQQVPLNQVDKAELDALLKGSLIENLTSLL
eukprot:TRINITY_DN10235_c0_g1_i2.p1 TRINITY_DN10235_c0_g1~~TRINITY_DN10235_c0_g1_i2.p1  ORF type:complete len:520 (+),score=88.34 TRINITY_DN10235_c0_g1_i2:78-1637(+)